MTRILIVDDEPQIRRILLILLEEKGFKTAEADSGERAIEILPEFRPDVALLDMSMPGMDGLATMRALLKLDKKINCIMMTAYGTIRSAVEAMKVGAFHYLTKPFDNDELIMLIDRAVEMRTMSREVEELRGELSLRYGFNEIVGISPKLQAVFNNMTKVARVDATVLIFGESGTGKELVARAIHRHSHRSKGPFVAVNCGAIPQSLFEAEFFGYERGAFTDAREARPGLFEQAHGGSLFLDEVGELPLETQMKLLRILQEREVTRLGGRSPIKVAVRVIAATHVDLKAAVEEGRFREDLYWRLNVVKLTLPSLRERAGDIPLLVDHILDRYNREYGLNVRGVSPEARQLLVLYDWPGNVRELENAICSAMIMCENGEIFAGDLPARVRGENEDEAGGVLKDFSNMTLADAVRETAQKIEKAMIISRLAKMGGNRTETAESLGISRKSLFNKMRQYELSDEEIESSI